MSNKPSFKQAQVEFAAHIRDPQNQPVPAGIESRRMAIYNKLFINSIGGLLSGSFPVIRSLYSDKDWEQLVRAFFREEHNKTPHFPEIPREFVAFLKQHPSDPKKPFLYELAHYEWLELHLEKHTTEISIDTACHTDQLLSEIPQVSPLVKLQGYHYPVHQIKTSHQPTTALEQPIFLLVWRDASYQVHFAELNPFSALLLEKLINNQNQTGQQILKDLAIQHNHPDISQFIEFGHQSMSQWLHQNIILSTKKT